MKQNKKKKKEEELEANKIELYKRYIPMRY